MFVISTTQINSVRPNCTVSNMKVENGETLKKKET